MKREINSRKMFGIFVLIIVSIGILYQFFSEKYYKKKLLSENTKIITGIVYKTKWQNIFTKRPGLVLYYSFHVNNVLFENHIRICYQCKESLSIELTNKKVPVIYCSDNPNYSYPLVTRKAFNYFNLSYPDSLKWIDNYMLKYELDSLNYKDLNM